MTGSSKTTRDQTSEADGQFWSLNTLRLSAGRLAGGFCVGKAIDATMPSLPGWQNMAAFIIIAAFLEWSLVGGGKQQ